MRVYVYYFTKRNRICEGFSIHSSFIPQKSKAGRIKFVAEMAMEFIKSGRAENFLIEYGKTIHHTLSIDVVAINKKLDSYNDRGGKFFRI